ncbi:hypothetical protein ABMA28_008772 [Loxostege sticticalis]|uniref:Uncharacterized protein n=1 Tax=Loxostege sticticalis TaxID=481309 RepID=A0ABD0SEM1_LOXSC
MGTHDPVLKNLGAKHRYYNEVVKEAIANNHTEINLENEDVKVLALIDIASHKRNLEFILNILKSDDLLYVSRAIKKCTWLITENSYAHIIDPDNLKVNLYPTMTSKAKHKLHKHIRNNIKDEVRAEKFYHAEDTIDASLKWLPKCSVPFIESKAKDHYDELKKTRLFKRLCERSINILNLIEYDHYLSDEKIKAAKFVQKKDIAIFLNAVERMPPDKTLNFNKNTTKLVMAYCPDKIIENFNKYCKHLHLPTFVKYLKPEIVKDFIYKQTSLEDEFPLPFFDNFQHFIQRMPVEERFDFVNKVFIEQVHKTQTTEASSDSEITKMKKLSNLLYCTKYEWYKFAPFDVALNALRHCSSDEKYDFLITLMKCCGRNQNNLQTVLKYYRDKHINDSKDSKCFFLNELLSASNFSFYDDITWSILNDFFKSLDVCSEADNSLGKYIEIIIVHCIIKNEPVPEQLQKKFVFNNTLIKYHKKLKPDDQLRVFNFIFNYVFQKTHGLNEINNEEEFNAITESLKSVLEILKDWSKELIDYPSVLQTIKDVVKIKTEKSWNSDLSHLYNVNKSWKKLMFEESLILEPSEKVCMNALKHDPGLLEQNEGKVECLLCDSKLYLKEFLKKVRIYFSEPFTKRVLSQNLLRLEHPNDHNVVIRNLCTLMGQEDILKVINKYTPKEAKINWDEEDGLMLSVRRHIAKNMHFTRPHPPPDAILSYAKGDYLQYAVPSVLAIFYNMNSSLFREQVPKLFNSPVSLQKLGIRLAVTKLNNDDLVKEFYNLWTNTKITSIRSIIFQFTYKLLCRQKDDHKIEELWNLLRMFIDNLTFKEDKAVYSLLYKTGSIPHIIKAKYIERNHTFLETYLAQEDTDIDEFQRYCMEETLLLDCKHVMENMNEDFIVRVLLKFVDEKFFCKSPPAKRPRQCYINPCDGIISVLSVFLLSAKDEQKQANKYKSILLPILQRALGKLKEEYRWRENIKALLDHLRINLVEYALKNNMIIPLKMFSDINEELVNSLNIPEYYTLLTQWKLTVEYVKHLHSTLDIDNGTEKISLHPENFGRKCLEILKQDVAKHFTRIYLIFYKVLWETLKDLCTEDERIEVFLNMLSDEDFIPGYLTITKIAAMFFSDYGGAWESGDKILQKLKGHPSKEVNMHYYYYFNEYRNM